LLQEFLFKLCAHKWSNVACSVRVLSMGKMRFDLHKKLPAIRKEKMSDLLSIWNC